MYVHEWRCESCRQGYGFKSYIEHPGQPPVCRPCSRQRGRPVSGVLAATHVVDDESLSKYSRQLVVKFVDTDNYGPIDSAGTALHNRARIKNLPSTMIEVSTKSDEVDDQVKEAFGGLAGGRLYLVGHGTAKKIHGTSPVDLAFRICTKWGLKACSRIGLVSCGTVDEAEHLDFASVFAGMIWRCRVRAEVVAYNRSVSVAPGELAVRSNNPYIEGRKAYFEGENCYYVKYNRNKVKKLFKPPA